MRASSNGGQAALVCFDFGWAPNVRQGVEELSSPSHDVHACLRHYLQISDAGEDSLIHVLECPC